MEEVFDACDFARIGKVPVSKLILTLKNEVCIRDDPELLLKEDVLMNIYLSLDPLKNDIEIDKATWVAAWRGLQNPPCEPQEINGNIMKNMAAGDTCTTMDVLQESPGGLNQSKRSFCFSPGSRSSSIESDSEEVVSLKLENQRLCNQVKTLKEQIQNQDDALVQEQSESQEQQKFQQDLTNRLNKRIELLQGNVEELQSTLDACENEKLQLCSDSVHQSGVEKHLRLELENKSKEIATMNQVIEELNRTKENYILKIMNLEEEMKDLTGVCLKLQGDHQDAMQVIITEKEEMSHKLSCLLFEKKDLSARLEEYELSGLSLQMNSSLLDPPQINVSKVVSQQDICSSETALSNSSTPMNFGCASKKLVNSLFEEMEAAGSFTVCDLDSSSEEEKTAETSVHGAQTADICQSFPLKITKGTDTFTTSEAASVDNENNVFLCEGDSSCRNQESLNEERKISIQAISIESQVEPKEFKDDQSTQTIIQVCDAKIQTEEHLSFDCISLQNTEIFSSKLCDRFIPETVSENTTFTSGFKFFKKSVVPHQSYSFTQTTTLDVEIQTEHHLAPNVLDVHNIEIYSSEPCEKWSCGSALSLTCVFLCLLLFMTILCTAAALETASQSGVLSFPYYGSTPRWIKGIVKPFIKIHRSIEPLPV